MAPIELYLFTNKVRIMYKTPDLIWSAPVLFTDAEFTKMKEDEVAIEAMFVPLEGRAYIHIMGVGKVETMRLQMMDK